jgi:hypothetical protein
MVPYHPEEATMKNAKSLSIVFLLMGLLVLTFSNTIYVEASVNPKLIVSGVNASSVSLSPDLENVTSYSYPFNIFGKTYTAFIVTNSNVSNLAMSESGIGIQFQADIPTGSTGFINVTVPAILLGTDIAVFQDGILLLENVSYTQIRNGTDYLFHLELTNGIHIIVVEALASDVNTPAPNDQSGVPIETILVIGAIGAGTAVCAAVIYAFKGAIFHKAGDLAGKGAIETAKAYPGGSGGGGSANVPVGANITVHPHPEVGLTFSQVKLAGAVTAAPLLSYPALPQGLKFIGTVFDIKTTAVFAGLVLVEIAFDGKTMNDGQKKKLRVYRNDFNKDSVWEDVTSSIDTKNNIAYGSTDHFSGFGVH